MKKIVIVVQLLLCVLVSAIAQNADTMPYQKYPVLPTFEVLELDSSDKFNTYNIPEGKPIVIIYFSPDCDHCEMLTEKMIENIDVLKKVRIYMFSFSSLVKNNEFYDKLNLKKYKNIKVGQDFLHFGFKFYALQHFPFAAIYDGNKKLVQAFPEKLTLEKLLDAVKEAKK